MSQFIIFQSIMLVEFVHKRTLLLLFTFVSCWKFFWSRLVANTILERVSISLLDFIYIRQQRRTLVSGNISRYLMAIFQYSILQYFTLYDGKQFANVIVHTSRINDHDCKQYLNPLISIEEFDWKRKYFTYKKNCKCIPMGQRLSNIIYFSHDDLVFYFLKTLIV